MLRAAASEIARWIGAELSGPDVAVAGVSADSRTLRPGELFVALAGARADGHDFAAAAVARGAAAVLAERRVAGCPVLLLHRQPRLALGLLARAWRERATLEVLAVAGSSGKTTVKNMLAAILAAQAPTHASAGNLNTEVGLPLALLAAPEEARFAVLEMGERLPGDVGWLSWIAAPRVAVLTNVGPAHLQFLGSLDGVADTLAALPAALPEDGIAVVPAEDPHTPRLLRDCRARTRIRFGLGAETDLRAEAIALGPEGSRFRLAGAFGEVAVELRLPGLHNVRNALAACAAAIGLGVPPARCAEALAAVQGAAGRLERRPLPGGGLLIDDSYNANPASVAAAIETLALSPPPRILVLGDMAELGAEAEEAHRAVGRLARARGIEALYAVGTLSRLAAQGFGSGARHFGGQEELVAALRAELPAAATVLVKGSRASAMERVAAALLASEGRSHAA